VKNAPPFSGFVQRFITSFITSWKQWNEGNEVADVFGWRGLSAGGTSVKVFQNGDWPRGNLPQWLCQPVKSDFDLAADRNINRMAALANTVTHTH
jgi:hypothetical protein